MKKQTDCGADLPNVDLSSLFWSWRSWSYCPRLTRNNSCVGWLKQSQCFFLLPFFTPTYRTIHWRKMSSRRTTKKQIKYNFCCDGFFFPLSLFYVLKIPYHTNSTWILLILLGINIFSGLLSFACHNIYKQLFKHPLLKLIQNPWLDAARYLLVGL